VGVLVYGVQKNGFVKEGSQGKTSESQVHVKSEKNRKRGGVDTQIWKTGGAKIKGQVGVTADTSKGGERPRKRMGGSE